MSTKMGEYQFISSKDYIYTTGDCNRISTDDGETWNSLPVYTQYVIGENNEGMIFSIGEDLSINVIDSTKTQGYYSVNYDTFGRYKFCDIAFSKKGQFGYAVSLEGLNYISTDNGRKWNKVDYDIKARGHKITSDDFNTFYCGFGSFTPETQNSWEFSTPINYGSDAIKISPKGRIFTFTSSKLYKSIDLIPTDVNNEEPQKEDLNIYIEDKILNIKQIDFGSKYKIFNILGLLVYESTALEGSQKIDLNILRNGAYVIEITSPTNIYRNKFLVY